MEGEGQALPAAAPPAAAPSGVSAASPAAVVSAPSTGAVSAAAPADGGQQQTPAQLRAAYEAVKAGLQPWEKLGAKPEEVSKVWESHQTTVNSAKEIGTRLGYTQQQVSDAIDQLGVYKVTAWLEQQAAKMGPPDPVRALEEKFNKVLEPILSERQTAEVQQQYKKFETATTSAVAEKLGGAQFVKDYPELAADIFDYASALMAQDPAVVAEVKKGNVSSVAKFVDQAYTRLTGSYKKFGDLMNKRAADDPAKDGKGPKPKPAGRITLDDIINGRQNATTAIPSMRQAGQ